MTRSKWIDLTGQIFGQLTVIERAKPFERRAKWVCRCTCGNLSTVYAANLKAGCSRSCGCAITDYVTGHIKHGHIINNKPTPTYSSWMNMIQRCTNPKHNRYWRYGGAGVKVYERWLVFANFLEDMGERPPETTLSRFGDIGNYEPGNVIWGNQEHQLSNRR